METKSNNGNLSIKTAKFVSYKEFATIHKEKHVVHKKPFNIHLYFSIFGQ